MGHWQLLLVIIISSAVGLSFGYWITIRRNQAAIAMCKDLEEKLVSAEAELHSYQGQVAEHFTQSAELINKLTDSYKTVHQHMVNGVNQLYRQEKAVPELAPSDLGPLSMLETPEVTREETPTFSEPPLMHTTEADEPTLPDDEINR